MYHLICILLRNIDQIKIEALQPKTEINEKGL